MTERYSKEEISHQLESIDHVKEALLKYKNTVIGEKYDLLPYHLTSTKEAILKTIHDKKSCIVSDITKVLGLSPGAITIVLNQLEDDELVNRIYKKQNRRSVWVELTEKGKKVVEILQATRVDFWSDLLSHLSAEERDQYFHIMKKISQKLQQ
ncbi:MarR family winged helix-turn-helix transcriptional regulator [Priestia megaterium]|uniref:MarR family winged helix-turn-helix transcriptional regulator n=1 Tax=Priestia megaterium TaxID=1404 RepID=UPI002DB99D05|nr:MarR family transcriptional regulator [Priestia megaterium]MEC1071058.1 MarR family transcriptional regulator [Priestia megaterium]